MNMKVFSGARIFARILAEEKEKRQNLLVVGVVGVANQYFMTFSDAGNVEAYLPNTGPDGQLTF